MSNLSARGISQSQAGTNPWTNSDLLSGIRLGCPENGLSLARQFDLQPPLQCSRDSMLQYIQALKTLSALQEAMEEVEYQIYVCQRTLKDSPLMGQDTVAKQLKMTRELLDHVGLLLEKKVDILKILKTPHTSGFISLEAPYHKYCYKVITSIPDMVNKLPNHLENLEWEQDHSTQDTIGLVDSKANDVTESLATCEDLTVMYRQVGNRPL